jgi:hypothetical protein
MSFFSNYNKINCSDKNTFYFLLHLLKAASESWIVCGHMNGFPTYFPKAPEMDNFLGHILILFALCSEIWKPVLETISGFRKSFRDSTSSFQNPCQPIGFEPKNPETLGEIRNIS